MKLFKFTCKDRNVCPVVYGQSVHRFYIECEWSSYVMGYFVIMFYQLSSVNETFVCSPKLQNLLTVHSKNKT